METKKITCIVCPKGCEIEADVEDGKVLDIRGNTCKRGYDYAMNEAVHPVRILTTTVKLNGNPHDRIAVRTDSAIPKELLFDSMSILKNMSVNKPVHMGDVLYPDLLNTGVNIIAAETVE